MSEQEKSGPSYVVQVNGDIPGQFAVGNNNVQNRIQGAPSADLAEVRRMLEELRARVEAEAPPEKKAEAVQQVEEIGKAIESKDPEDVPDRLGRVKSWFKQNLPALAGAVVSVIVNPIVGKVVEAAGTGLAAEVQRRFGAEK